MVSIQQLAPQRTSTCGRSAPCRLRDNRKRRFTLAFFVENQNSSFSRWTDVRKSVNRYRFALAGACYGMLAWLTYGMVELCSVAVLPWFVHPAYEYKAYDAGFSAILLVLYAAVGAASGCVIGLIAGSGKNAARRLRAAATVILTLVLLLGLRSAWGAWAFPPVILLTTLVVLLAASLCSATGGGLGRWCYPLAAAWLPASAYLVSQWLADWLRNRGASIQQAAVYVTLLIAGLFLVALIAGRWARTPRVFPTRSLAGIAVFAIACCLLTAALGPVPQTLSGALPPPAQGRPNIILISLDTVRADHLSVYGYHRNTTPNLKNFARESVVFTHAVSASDMTLPSHASMFTGLYPSQHGAHFSAENRLGVPLDSHFLTLAEMLHSRGFWTAGVIANGGYLSGAFGLNQGFAYWDQSLPSMILAPAPAHLLRARIRNVAARFLPTSELDRVSRSAEQINEAVFRALDARPRDGRAAFLFINYMDAHVPYIPPAPYDTMFEGKDGRFTESRYMSTYLDVMAHNRKIRGEARDHLVSQYDGGIAYLDAQLASLFSGLKARELYDNSLIIVTSDHGESFGERNSMDHGGLSAYQEQVHVPLLIKYPNTLQSVVIEQPASTIDLLPTALDAAGIPAPQGLPGQSLSPIAGKSRDVISESFPGGRAYYTNASRFNRTYRSLVSAPFKFIAATPGTPELYDLERDPGESTNLYDPGDTKSQELAARLNAWSRSVVRQRKKGVKIDSDAVERLKSLGYVQ
jgi:arylsulfatase A-like enzyme